METPTVDAIATGDFVTTWRQVMQDPAGFYATMPESGGLAEPMRFLATCAAIDAAGTFLVSWSVAAALWAFVVLVVAAVLLASALTLVTQQLFDGPAGFEPVFRAVAYGSAPAVVLWVPLLGGIACVYAWFLHVRGIERVQTLDAGRATLATTVAWAGLWLVVRGARGIRP
jgi:hypothetical protein